MRHLLLAVMALASVGPLGKSVAAEVEGGLRLGLAWLYTGGAAALAALISGAYVPSGGERICVVICGANTGAVNLPDSAKQ